MSKDVLFNGIIYQCIFELEDGGGFKLSSLENMSILNRNNLVVQSNCMLYGSHREGSTNNLSLTARAIGAIATQFIQCQVSKNLVPSDKLLTYIVLKVEQIDFRDIFVHNIRLAMKNLKQKLPYPCLIIYLLTTIGVSLFRESTEK